MNPLVLPKSVLLYTILLKLIAWWHNKSISENPQHCSFSLIFSLWQPEFPAVILFLLVSLLLKSEIQVLSELMVISYFLYQEVFTEMFSLPNLTVQRPGPCPSVIMSMFMSMFYWSLNPLCYQEFTKVPGTVLRGVPLLCVLCALASPDSAKIIIGVACVCACVLSHFMSDFFADPRIVSRQAPLSMEFSRQEYWGGLPCPLPGELPNPGIKPTSPVSFASAGRIFTC